MIPSLRLLLLALWLGAALFFSAVVAPGAFTVLRAYGLPNATEIAGALVTRTLSVINVSGFIGSLVLIATAFLAKRGNSGAFYLETVSLALLAVTTSVGHWIIAARMRSLRAGLTLPIDQVPVSDPTRIAFNTLHGYSVTALSIAMIAALVAFALIAYRARLNTG